VGVFGKAVVMESAAGIESIKIQYSLPNEHGVYSKSEAYPYEYEDRNIFAVVHTMNVEPGIWIFAFSYSKKVEACGTQGVGSPLIRRKEYRSEAECLVAAKKSISKVIDDGVSQNIQSWCKTWNNMDIWAHQLGEQLELFA